jgi:AraC family ethanolamine operon transcriptional activator
MDDNTWSIQAVPINGPDDLREATRGSDLKIVQLRPGKLHGAITHIAVGNLGISVGQFTSGIRARGPMDQERIVLGTMLASAGRAAHWWKDVRAGDAIIFPPGVEADAISLSGEAFVGVSVAQSDLMSIVHGEDRLADPALWQMSAVHPTDPRIREKILRGLNGMISDVMLKTTAPSAQAADFFQRSIIEAFLMSLINSLPPDRGRFCSTGARLVREADDYVDASGGRPVHISELCSALKVTRRNLHRAFADTLGMGPVAYLRRRRLSAIHSVLKRCDPATISIGDLAFEYGFPEPGRFAAYYRAHFGERPSETFRSAF